MFDLLIKGGLVADGTGRPARRADVGVENGRVSGLGDLSGAQAAKTLDASGLLIAPNNSSTRKSDDRWGAESSAPKLPTKAPTKLS